MDKATMCEAALQTETKHDAFLYGGLVKISEHNKSLAFVILLLSKIADTIHARCQNFDMATTVNHHNFGSESCSVRTHTEE